MHENQEENQYKPKYPVLTLVKTLQIINYFKLHGSAAGLSLSEVCEKLNMKKSSVHRILDTLFEYNYVEKTLVGNKYRLSWELYHVGNTVPQQHNLYSGDYIPLMNQLCEMFSESMSIGVLDSNMVVIIYCIEPNTRLKASGQIGLKDPLYATAKGKLFMSEFADNKVYDFYRENNIRSFTRNTIITPGKMLNELYDIRESKFAMDREEQCEGLTCISMPVRDYSGKIIAAISASGPTARLLSKIESGLKDSLSEITNKLSRQMGYQV